LNGIWYGQILDYVSGEFRRNLTVRVTKAGPACVWQEVGQQPEQPPCVIEGDNISFTTKPGSQVQLHLQHNNTLAGTFLRRDSKSFKLSMGREPVDLRSNVSVIGVWKGEVHCEYQNVSEVQWNITGQKENGILEEYGSVRSGGRWTFSGTRVQGHELKMNRYEQLVISGNKITGKWRALTDLCDVFMVKQ
jgi:hypothetical protein